MASCVNCKELENCGTVNRYIRDFSKAEIRKLVQAESHVADCPDFSFVAVSGEVLRDRIKNLYQRSDEKKSALKQAQNKPANQKTVRLNRSPYLVENQAKNSST